MDAPARRGFLRFGRGYGTRHPGPADHDLTRKDELSGPSQSDTSPAFSIMEEISGMKLKSLLLKTQESVVASASLVYPSAKLTGPGSFIDFTTLHKKPLIAPQISQCCLD